jgi:acetate kinase
MGRKIVLSVNAGSSSIKTAAYELPSHSKTPEKLATIQIENIGSPEIKVKFDSARPKDKKASNDAVDTNDFKSDTPEEALSNIVEHLVGNRGPVEISSKDDITFVAHRVVHGGEAKSPKVLDEEILHYLEELSDLAPLYVLRKSMPSLTYQTQCHSSQTHSRFSQTTPKYNQRFML